MAAVRWTPQAVDDLEATCLFIARDASQVAAAFADRVLRATDQLAHFPCLGRIVPELGIDNVREIVVGSYRIICRTLDEEMQEVYAYSQAEAPGGSACATGCLLLRAHRRRKR